MKNSKHDRYLIYKMKGKDVSIKSAAFLGRKKVSGLVRFVYRDIMADTIELSMDDQTVVIREPNIITGDGNGTIQFVYGDPDKSDFSDKGIFRELASMSHSGGNIDDVIRKLESHGIKTVTIQMTDPA